MFYFTINYDLSWLFFYFGYIRQFSEHTPIETRFFTMQYQIVSALY